MAGFDPLTARGGGAEDEQLLTAKQGGGSYGINNHPDGRLPQPTYVDGGNGEQTISEVLAFLSRVFAAVFVLALASSVLVALRVGGALPGMSFTEALIPIDLGVVVLVVALQSRRLAWAPTVVWRGSHLVSSLGLVGFLVLLSMRLDAPSHDTPTYTGPYLGIFLPVYVFLAVYCLCGCFGVVAGCAMRRFQRYMIAWTLLLIVASLAPFAILLQLRLSGSHIAWALVLTPLFVNDAFLLCVAFFLVLFSCGAIEDAVFSLRQLCAFLCVVPASITFKVLLISYLDNRGTVAPVTVAVPLFVLEALLVCCMLDVARRSGRRLKRPLLD